MIIAAIGVVFMYKMHFWVERRFKIDDAVGAVAVHGYAGWFGVVIAGFVLWGYPASMNPDYATISPWGQFVGAWIMFGLLGFLPAWIVAGILKKMNLLRIPPHVELAGLDLADYEGRYLDESEVYEAELNEARDRGLIS
jgi:ammonia channel protein AmtB